jgi:hypothetical protein
VGLVYGKQSVAPGFWAGAKLEARHPLLQGSAASSWVVKLRSTDEARPAASQNLIRHAARLDAQDPLNPSRQARRPSS